MRSLRSIVCCGLLALAGVAPSLSAQLAELQPGVRVRLAAPGVLAGKFEGTVISRSADSLVVASPSSAPVSMAVSRVTSLEVSRGKSRGAGAQRGMLWGAPIGLAFGLATVQSVRDCTNCTAQSNRIPAGEWLAVSVLSGLGYGAAIGALIGRERWERYELAPRPVVGMRSGRASFGVNVGI